MFIKSAGFRSATLQYSVTPILHSSLSGRREVVKLAWRFLSVDARLREGIRLFNAGRYFDSHESLEDFYRRADESDKPFLEGLIQLAAALRVFRDFDEVKGPVRMARQALIRLENYQPAYLGIKVTGLIGAIETWAAKAESKTTATAPSVPKISLRRFGWF